MRRPSAGGRFKRIGLEQGRAVALDGIALALELKFGAAAQPVIDASQQITDLAVIEAIMARIKTAQSLAEVQHTLDASAP
jgi:hypothetical protein